MKKILLITFILLNFSSCLILKNFNIDSKKIVNNTFLDFVEYDAEEKYFLESSGLSPSLEDNKFFTHPDSFNRPSFFSFEINNKNLSNYREYKIKNFINFDFEDICTDNFGTIFLANIGDNLRFRTVKNILCFDERELKTEGKNTPFRNINFSFYENKKIILSDSEAIFYFKGCLYLISKSNNLSYIFKLDIAENKKSPLKANKIGCFKSYGLVTSADLFGEKYLAVLTYTDILIFDIADKDFGYNSDFNLDDNLVAIFPHKFSSSEGICFSNTGDLLISTELDKLYVIENFINRFIK